MNAPLFPVHTGVSAYEKVSVAGICAVSPEMHPSEILALQALQNLSAGNATPHGVEAILMQAERLLYGMSKRRGMERLHEAEGLIAEALLSIGNLTEPTDCAECAGTGEGMHGGSCGLCRGRGERA